VKPTVANPTLAKPKMTNLIMGPPSRASTGFLGQEQVLPPPPESAHQHGQVAVSILQPFMPAESPTTQSQPSGSETVRQYSQTPTAIPCPTTPIESSGSQAHPNQEEREGTARRSMFSTMAPLSYQEIESLNAHTIRLEAMLRGALTELDGLKRALAGNNRPLV
jgi:hypothetical protein